MIYFNVPKSEKCILRHYIYSLKAKIHRFWKQPLASVCRTLVENAGKPSINIKYSNLN